MLRVDVRPELYRWARRRARLGVGSLTKRFPKLEAWEAGSAQPTLKQLEAFASATHTPVGFLLLPAPPVESIPIPDFRTMGSTPIEQPSADLLDTIYVCQQRQEWYRDYARSSGLRVVPFVGSARLGADVVATANTIRETLQIDLDARRRARTWEEALRSLYAHADDAGILAMCSGIVLSNTHRKLDPSEFRGFALADDVAPLVFVNGADSKSAQMFTLAHELVHLWLGQSALSSADARTFAGMATERWCNQVAAELLVPIAAVRAQYDPQAGTQDEMMRLARTFKVSTLVMLRRLHDIGALTLSAFRAAYDIELERLTTIPAKGGGGDFHLTEAVRVSRRFARAIVDSTLEGQTLYRDAFRMLGFSKLETFREFGHSLGVTY